MYLDRSVGFIISATNTKMKNKLTKTLEAFHVTHEQWALLSRLWETDGITQKELSERSLKDQPTTARILDKLERRGLIIRRTNPTDRRSFLIYLTNEGKEIKTPLTKLARQALAEATNGLTDQEQLQLKKLLVKIIDNLD